MLLDLLFPALASRRRLCLPATAILARPLSQPHPSVCPLPPLVQVMGRDGSVQGVAHLGQPDQTGGGHASTAEPGRPTPAKPAPSTGGKATPGKPAPRAAKPAAAKPAAAKPAASGAGGKKATPGQPAGGGRQAAASTSTAKKPASGAAVEAPAPPAAQAALPRPAATKPAKSAPVASSKAAPKPAAAPARGGSAAAKAAAKQQAGTGGLAAAAAAAGSQAAATRSGAARAAGGEAAATQALQGGRRGRSTQDGGQDAAADQQPDAQPPGGRPAFPAGLLPSAALQRLPRIRGISAKVSGWAGAPFRRVRLLHGACLAWRWQFEFHVASSLDAQLGCAAAADKLSLSCAHYLQAVRLVAGMPAGIRGRHCNECKPCTNKASGESRSGMHACDCSGTACHATVWQ